MKNIFYILLVAGILSSCEKYSPTIATIVVRNEAGQAVPGATVLLRGEGSGSSDNEERFDITLTTDGSGKAFYDFSEYYKQGQAGFAVLDISAHKGSLYAEGIIKVEPEKSNEESVVLE